jgi:1,4-alpha-glucan branching enzyme
MSATSPVQTSARKSASQPRAAKTASTRVGEIATARPQAEQRRKAKPVRFRFRSADAQSVFVAGSFNDWRPTTALTQRDGEWTGEIQLDPGTYEYRFVVDGRWIEDPSAPDQATNPYGGRNSVLRV